MFNISDKEINWAFNMENENQAVYAELKPWCEHINVEANSPGLISSGLLKVVCPHGISHTLSMVLKRLATGFILENCTNCKYHKELNPNNFGRKVLEESKKIEEEEKNPQPKEKLRNSIADSFNEVLNTSHTDEQSILVLIDLLDEPGKNFKAAEELLKASKFAPEYFNEYAQKVILLHLLNEKHGRICFEIAENILNSMIEPPDFYLDSINKFLEQSSHPEDACLILRKFINKENLEECRPLVEDVICGEEYLELDFDRIYYPNSLSLLVFIGNLDINFLTIVFEKCLEVDNKSVRANVNYFVQNLITIFPDIYPSLLKPLIKSFELEDDRFDDSANSITRDTITEIFFSFQEETLKAIKENYDTLSEQAKVELYKFFNNIVRKIEEKNLNEYVKINICELIISEILSILNNLAFPPKIKHPVSRALSYFSSSFPKIAIENLEAIIEILQKIICNKNEILKNDQPNASYINGSLNSEYLKLDYSKSVEEITKAIEHLAEEYPDLVFEKVKPIVENLNSKDNPVLKSNLISIFTKITESEKAIEIIPLLYSFLNDPDSYQVRRQALEILQGLIFNNKELIPDNVIETLPKLILDSYVAVHKEAVRTCLYCSSFDKKIISEIIVNLVHLEAHYFSENEDLDFRKDIVLSLLGISKHYPETYKKIIEKYLVKYCNTGKYFTDKKMLEQFSYILKNDSSLYDLFIKQFIPFYQRTHRDNFTPEDSRFRSFQKLFDAPLKAIEENLELITSCTKFFIKEDKWDAINLIEILGYFEFHNEVVELCKIIEKEYPNIKSNKYILDHSKRYRLLSEIEINISNGELYEAIDIINKNRELFIERKESSNPRTTSRYTQEISDRLK